MSAKHEECGRKPGVVVYVINYELKEGDAVSWPHFGKRSHART
jgi:hypothetical protein